MGVKVTNPVKQENLQVGTEGNYVEPIDGEQIPEEELADQYFMDFGDDIDSFMGTGVISEEPRETNAEVSYIEDTSEHDVISPDGQVVNRKVKDSEPAKQEKEQNVDLSDYVPKSEFEQLTKDFNSLQGEYNDLKKTVNAGLSNVSDTELKILRKIKHDYENSPLGLIVEDYYKGKLDINKIAKASSSPQDFMPDGDIFDASEAYTPGSPSYDAREKWEEDKNLSKQKYSKASEYISELSKHDQLKSQEELENELEQQNEELLKQLMSKVPSAEKHRDSFIKWLQSQSNIFMVAWPTYAAAVNEAMRRKSGGGKPAPAVSGLKSSDSSYMPDSDSEMREIFGD